jgi:hypothetical protein
VEVGLTDEAGVAADERTGATDVEEAVTAEESSELATEAVALDGAEKPDGMAPDGMPPDGAGPPLIPPPPLPPETITPPSSVSTAAFWTVYAAPALRSMPIAPHARIPSERSSPSSAYSSNGSIPSACSARIESSSFSVRLCVFALYGAYFSTASPSD